MTQQNGIRGHLVRIVEMLMVNKRHMFYATLFSFLSLTSCLTTVTYNDYDYESSYISSSELKLTVKASGTPRELPGSKLQEVRDSPYTIRLVFSDNSLDYLAARVLSAELKGIDSAQVTMIDFGSKPYEFWITRENKKSQTATSIFSQRNIPMNKEDYTLKLKMEFCKASGCFNEDFNITMKLKLNKRVRNANWEAMQGI